MIREGNGRNRSGETTGDGEGTEEKEGGGRYPPHQPMKSHPTFQSWLRAYAQNLAV